MCRKLMHLGLHNAPIKCFTFNSANFSQRFHLSSINFILISKLGISESPIHGIRFLKTFSPSPKALSRKTFSFFFFFSGLFVLVPSYMVKRTFPGSSHYEIVTYSISALPHVRPHSLLSLRVALKSQQLPIIYILDSLLASLLTTPVTSTLRLFPRGGQDGD